MASAPRKGNDDETIADIGERLGPCPTCGQEIVLGLGEVAEYDFWSVVKGYVKDARKRLHQKKRVLVHALPPCDYFIDTDAHVIIRAIARAAKRAGQDLIP